MADPISQFATRIAYGARQLPRVAWYIGHGMVMRRLSRTVRARAGQGPPPQARVKVPDRRRLYADMAVLFQRDLANVEAGIYPLPADHDGTLPVVLNRSRLLRIDLATPPTATTLTTTYGNIVAVAYEPVSATVYFIERGASGNVIESVPASTPGPVRADLRLRAKSGEVSASNGMPK